MIYKCKQCEFTSFNEKALEMHKEEKHKVLSKPKKEETLPETKSEKILTEQPTSENVKIGLNFMLGLKGKKVSIEGINGRVVTGILKKFNDYELNIETESGIKTIFKHSLFMIWEETT